ncbi:MAG: succinate dehydrogenase cytochrome b subunit [Verrucomicrobiota bacterium]
MNLFLGILGSSLGKKYLMALTGVVLFGFVIGHMLGNLQIFLGRDSINSYAHFLKSEPILLWTARLGLLLMVIIHVWAAVKLSLENKAARPIGYADTRLVAASYASRTMVWSGVIIFAFVVYHLMHFTAGITNPEYLRLGETLPDGTQRHDVYRMIILGFSNLWVSGFYILSMALLCLHLSHGVSSLFQSLGLKNKYYGRHIDRFAKAAALAIFLGNCSIPVAILFRFIE